MRRWTKIIGGSAAKRVRNARRFMKRDIIKSVMITAICSASGLSLEDEVGSRIEYLIKWEFSNATKMTEATSTL